MTEGDSGAALRFSLGASVQEGVVFSHCKEKMLLYEGKTASFSEFISSEGAPARVCVCACVTGRGCVATTEGFAWHHHF